METPSRIAVAEGRVAKFVLWPLSIIFALGAWSAFHRGQWWIAASFIVLIAYNFHLTYDLVGRSASILDKLLFPFRAPLRLDPDSEEQSDERHRELPRTIAHAYYAVVAATTLMAKATWLELPWAILIGFVLLLLMPLVRTLITYLVYESPWR